MLKRTLNFDNNITVIDTFEICENCYYTFRVTSEGRIFESLTDGVFNA